MFYFSRSAEKRFKKLPKTNQEHIISRLKAIKSAGTTNQIDTLRDFLPATHRLRIGDYRLILEKTSENEYLILDIGHRKDIYK